MSFEKIDIPILEISDEVQKIQINKLKSLKKERSNKIVKKKLKEITSACKSNKNLLPLIIDASLEYATLGEIVNAMKEVFGEWQETSFI